MSIKSVQYITVKHENTPHASHSTFYKIFQSKNYPGMQRKMITTAHYQ
ncbi:hypothetical protein [Terrimonas sp.]|nr:hypothetical protein [Terrimonas sp.]